MTEEVLAGKVVAEQVRAAFGLPPDVADEVKRRFARNPTPQGSAISLLGALDWLSAVGSPLKAIGMAAAMQSFWLAVRKSGDLPQGSRLVEQNTALLVQATGFSLVRIGAFEELMELDRFLRPTLQSSSMQLTACSLSVFKAQILLRMGHPAEARAMLPTRDDIAQAAALQEAANRVAPHPGATLIMRDNIAIDLGLVETSAVGEVAPFEERWGNVVAEVVEGVRSILGRHGQAPARVEEAVSRIMNAAAQLPRDTAGRLKMVASLIGHLRETLAEVAPGVEYPVDDLLSVADATARSAPDGPPPLDALSRLMEREQGQRDEDGWQSFSWLKSTLLERAGRTEEALDTLEGIKASRTKLIAGAATPEERAGLAGSFADLAPRLAKLRGRLGKRDDAVFEAIEWGKGQWISERASEPVPDFEAFRKALTWGKVHYLTFAVGSDSTIGMLVLAAGEPLRMEIGVGRDEIAEAALALYMDPKFRGDLHENLSRSLGLLTNWIPEPGPGKPIGLGDVLIVAPHGPLHEIPIHAMPARDGLPLAPRAAIVRTHGAAMVAGALGRAPSRPPSFFALRAPTADEANEPRRKGCFDSVVAALAATMDGTLAEGVGADYDALAKGLKDSQVVHLWAHGDVAIDGRYYTGSGLLLSHGGHLPFRGSEAFRTPHLLSPQRLLGGGGRLALAKSHVTLQACVSGHARANLRGDAIGLEWALLLAGADSVAGSHWHVDYQLATKFCLSFYRLWLGAGTSRAEAWRRTAEGMAANQGLPPSAWAAFTLTGDWR